MKGFMRQRGQSWELRVFLGHDPVTGKQRYATRSVRGGKREAQRVLAEMITEAERGQIARTRATFGELVEAWFALASPDFSPSTVREVRGMLDRAILPALGERPLSKLQASELDAFYRRLAAGGGRNGQPLKASTVRRIHGLVHRALAQGVKWGWIPTNPAAATSPPRVLAPKITPPDPAGLGRVLRRAAEESPELACYLVLAAATGARRSELVALRWPDIELDGGTVTISRGIVFGPDGLVEKDTKTHAERRVSLDARTLATLADHRQRMAERAAVCGTSLAANAFVFSHSVEGVEPWFPDSVSRDFKRLCRQEGLPDARLHDLRHFVATQLLGAGVDVRTVAGRLGHRNAATTLNVYASFLRAADQKAADVIGNIIAREDDQ
jgi:integrase